MSLQGIRVLVTGGSRGIGRALCEALRDAGCEVLACGRDAEALADLERDTAVRGLTCDVTVEGAADTLLEAVRRELGGLDVLINNAGMQCDQDPGQGLDRARVVQELQLNLLAPILLTDALLPLLTASPVAAVVNMSSALGVVPSARSPVYGATKAGLSCYTRAARGSLASVGVRCVEVVPPLVATGMTTGRQQGAVAPEVVADAVVDALRTGQERVVVGKARILLALHRLSPALAAAVMDGR